MMHWITILGLVLLCGGVLCFAVSLLGALRSRKALNALHAAAVGETLGLLLVLLGLMLIRAEGVAIAKLSCILIFAWLTAPLATHLIAWTQFHGEYFGFPEHGTLYRAKKEEDDELA